MKKKLIFLVIVLILALPFIYLVSKKFSQSREPVTQTGFYFDTVISITIYDPSDDADDQIAECFDLAARYENLFSAQKEGSDVSKINACAGDGNFVAVDSDTLELIQKGLYYCQKSDGAFDLTIGKLSELWNFSEISENADDEDHEVDASVLPDDAAIQEMVSHIDYHVIEAGEDGVRLTDSQAAIDLGGIAKGYIADRMKDCLVEHGVDSAIINLGGNVLVVGEKTDGSPFKVGIQQPFAADGEVAEVLEVTDSSVVTSGVYERYYRVNGRLYHHLLDPSTGYPVDNGLASVTILSEDSVDGDALSTACFVLGREKGKALIDEINAENGSNIEMSVIEEE